MLRLVPETHAAHGELEVTADGSTHVVNVPDAQLLFGGTFKRAGTDLILSDRDHNFIVHDYFRAEHLPTLVGPEGGRITSDVVVALTGHGDYAQAGPAQPAAAEAVGRIVHVGGADATIVRNGVAITLHVGDAILKGDVLQSGSAALVVTFNDGSTLNLTPNTRLVVNDFVYDPHGSANSEILNLLKGSLVFASGEVAHSGGHMNIKTPVATLGIRGTEGTVDDGDGSNIHFSIIKSATGADIVDSQGHVVAHIVQGSTGYSVHFEGVQVVAQEEQKSPQQVAAEQQLLQEILTDQAIGQQILQQFSQNGPQSTQQHTQIDLTIPYTAVVAILSGNPVSDNTNAVVTTTTTTTTPTGDTTTTTTTQELQIQPNPPPVANSGVYWSGDTGHSGDWTTNSNWNSGQTPTANDNVTIGQDQNNQPVPNAQVNSSTPVQARSLILHNGAQLSAPQIEVAGDIAIFGDGSGPGATEIYTTSGDLVMNGIDDGAIGGDLFLQATTRGAAIIAGGNLTIGPTAGAFTVEGSAEPCATNFAEISSENGNLAIEGVGTNFLNEGLIHADNGVLAIGEVGGTFVNAGVFRAAELHILSNPDNPNVQPLENQGKLLIFGDCESCSTVGIEVHNTGLVKVMGGTLAFAEQVVNDGCGVISATQGGEIDFHGGLHNAGDGLVIALGCESAIYFDCGWVDNCGTIAADWGGTIDFNHWVGGGGTLALDGGTIELGSGTCNSIDFSGCGGGTLVLDCATAPVGQINGFGADDAIDFAGLHDLSIVGYTANGCDTGGVLDLHSTSLGDFSLSFMGDGTNYSIDNFMLLDQGCGTVLTEAPAFNVLNQSVDSQAITNITTVYDLAVGEPFAGNQQLTVSASAGDGTLSLLGFDGLTGDSGSSSGEISATGTLADINTALTAGVLYTPNQNAQPDTDHVNLTVAASGGGGETLNLVFNVNGPDGITLDATAANDVLYATDGNDSFHFNADQAGHDVVAGFDAAHDVVDFDSTIFSTVSDVLASAHDDPYGNAVIDAGNHGTVTVAHVSVAQLDASNLGILHS